MCNAKSDSKASCVLQVTIAHWYIDYNNCSA